MNENVWERQELLFKIKLLKDRVEAFESGEKYVQMERLHKVARAGDFRTIQHLKKELAQERAEKVHVRELWYATCLDIQNECDYKLKEKEKECAKKLAEKDQVILLLQKDLQDAREQQEAEHKKYLNQLKEAYDAKTQLEEEKEKNQEEYGYEPPSKYYKDGYNTYKRMEESPEEYVLFLRDPGVPPTNNTAERYGRKFKRKAHQVMSFRSQLGADRFCDGLTITESIKEINPII